MKLSKRTILTLALLTVLLIGSVSASWVIKIKSSQITGAVTSNKDQLVFIQNTFTDFGLIDTTNASVTFNETAIIQNQNGDLVFIASFNETRIDMQDECFDYENDCQIQYYYLDNEIFDSDNITIVSGVSELTAVISFSRSSCPQNVSIDFTLDEVTA